jgi:hypothetical protein
LAFALAAVGLVACGDDDSGPSTFEEEGIPFTFEYPGSMGCSLRSTTIEPTA